MRCAMKASKAVTGIFNQLGAWAQERLQLIILGCAGWRE
jgi:hypothetical protein